MGRDVDVQELPLIVLNDEPDIEQLVSNSRDDEEVHRRDRFSVVSQERGPALSLAVSRPPLWQVARHRRQRNTEPKLLELGLDLPCSPTIFHRESSDEYLQLRGDRRSPGTGPRDRSPVEAEAPPVPLHNCLGLHDAQNVLPPWPDAGEADPEGAVDGGQSRSGTLRGISRELLAQGELYERLLTLASEESPHARKKDRHISDQDLKHVAILREDTLERETDSDGQSRVSSPVDRPVSETGKLNRSGPDGY